MREVLGIDLDDFFRGRRDWGELDYAFDTLCGTSGSHLWAANQNDDELAEILADMTNGNDRASGEAARPPLIGWTNQRADMATLIDWVTIDAMQGSKKFKPLPRPSTAMERVKAERKDVKMSSVAAKLTGKG